MNLLDLRLDLSRIAARLRDCATLVRGGHDAAVIERMLCELAADVTACGLRCRRT
jgi:hypothetical protein